MTQVIPSLFHRVLRSSAITAGAFVIAQALRFGSNLILTRLLFPEAFGLMALVTVVLVGLAMFSDMGIGPAISQHKDGDNPDFLDTAWTINVVRGGLLWGVTCVLALPAAHLYQAPALSGLLPLAGVTLLIAGFNPTRIDTANRHLLLGRVTILDLIAQTVGVAAIILLAWLMRSVWALAIGSLLGAMAKLLLTWMLMPGRVNRFVWNPAAGRDLIHFGKWIFLSTACGFLLAQGDKAILGATLTMSDLGIYNIGYFLGSFPVLLGGAVSARVLIPLYRDAHPAQAASDAARLRWLRLGLSGAMLALLAAMALLGVPLVELLYDNRYQSAGAILVAVACVQMPQVVGMTYDHAALAAGQSRPFFLLMALRALVQTLAFLLGATLAGLLGALIGQALATYAVYPAVARLARRFHVWDPRHDLIFISMAVALTVLAIWLNCDQLSVLWRDRQLAS
jgi:O-antigen/teichoic acid export membrane protein